jgi:ferritin-like metal-binding protein YciE
MSPTRFPVNAAPEPQRSRSLGRRRETAPRSWNVLCSRRLDIQPTTGSKREIDMATLREAFVNEIKDLYHAEKQLIRALPKLSKSAANSDLRAALDAHLEETEQHVSRLEEVFEHLDERASGKACAGMAGIVEEGSEILREKFDDDVMDAAIIAAAQRAEHYEIAAYGTAASWAEALGLAEIADLLGQTLEEEKAADQKLTELAEQGINAAATSGNGSTEPQSDRANNGGAQRRRKMAAGKSR